MDREFQKSNQYYLNVLYKTIFTISYYSMLRIGEVVKTQTANHTIKVKDISIATNKEKIQLILYTSKAHRIESPPQIIKISSIADSNLNEKEKTRFFCPFKLMKEYFALRGDYEEENEKFFIFRDGTPVTQEHVRNILTSMLEKINLDALLYLFHGIRSGRACDMFKLGYTVDEIKQAGRWKSNAVFRYLKNFC